MNWLFLKEYHRLIHNKNFQENFLSIYQYLVVKFQIKHNQKTINK